MQSPLITIPPKTTTEVDLAGPLRQLIGRSFGADPGAFGAELAALDRARTDAVGKGAGSEATQRDLLFKYFGQLELLELRFPELKVAFTWFVRSPPFFVWDASLRDPFLSGVPSPLHLGTSSEPRRDMYAESCPFARPTLPGTMPSPSSRRPSRPSRSRRPRSSSSSALRSRPWPRRARGRRPTVSSGPTTVSGPPPVSLSTSTTTFFTRLRQTSARSSSSTSSA